MSHKLKHSGVVVPMLSPITEDGRLDEPAVDNLIDFLLAGGVGGIFVLGTTGEGISVPRSLRRSFVERVVSRVKAKVKVYAGLGDAHPDEVTVGNSFFEAGADAVVAHPPAFMPTERLFSWYRSMLDGLEGPLLLYNMPLTTEVSVPLDVVDRLLGHRRLAGIKDSENNGQRLEELLRRFGGRSEFAIFVGVGALMLTGLKLGASGIVPSVGNLIPDVCQRLCLAAHRCDWTEAEKEFTRMNAVAMLYQQGRTLNESLAALKGAVHCRGLCAPYVLPPLRKLNTLQLENLRFEMMRLNLLSARP